MDNSNSNSFDNSQIKGKGETWQRTMPSSLLSLPINTPSLTTVVALSSLPMEHRSFYFHKLFGSDEQNGGDENDALVEVPTEIVAACSPSDVASSGNRNEIGSGSSSVKNRPITGNLSSKLIEYTRGTVGARRPFTVSGQHLYLPL